MELWRGLREQYIEKQRESDTRILQVRQVLSQIYIDQEAGRGLAGRKRSKYKRNDRRL